MQRMHVPHSAASFLPQSGPMLTALSKRPAAASRHARQAPWAAWQPRVLPFPLLSAGGRHARQLPTAGPGLPRCLRLQLVVP